MLFIILTGAWPWWWWSCITFFPGGIFEFRAYHVKRNCDIYKSMRFRKFSTIVWKSCIWGWSMKHLPPGMDLIWFHAKHEESHLILIKDDVRRRTIDKIKLSPIRVTMSFIVTNNDCHYDNIMVLHKTKNLSVTLI